VEFLLLTSFLLFMVGAVLGSFVNVVIYRSIHGESWAFGRSHCDHCRHKIAWYDNVPLFSYFWLGGKCRNCRKPIGITHPVVEFLMGSLLVWWYAVGFFFFRLTQEPLQAIQPVFWLIVGMLLVVILVADFIYMIIPDAAVGLLLGMTVCYRLALVWFGVMQPADLWWSVGGAVSLAVFFVCLWAGTKGKGMGLGDVKVAIPLALLVGWPNVLVLTMSAFCLGATAGIGLVLSKRRKVGQVIPFGPFLILGTAVALVWGDGLVGWYMRYLLGG
jgi:prepilin signal peptidase PulO-like enzyme (type II secretory pathway)